MSFFDDLLKSFEIGGIKNELVVSIVVGVGVMVTGDVKIISFSDEEVFIEYKKKVFKVSGEGLNIMTMAKGEIVIRGNVLGFARGDNEK